MPSSSRLRFLAASLIVFSAIGCQDPAEDFALGTLERQRIELVASAAEPVADVAVAAGDEVEAGRILVRLDDRRVAAGVDAASARVRQAEARIAELVRGARSERRDEMLARIEADRSELKQAKLDQTRAAGLVTSGVAPQSRLDEAQTRVETAQARLEADRAALDEMVSGATAEELRQARAEMEGAEAEVVALQVDLERLTVRAPTAGRVDALPYRVGEAPGAGATLAVLLAMGEPYARVYVPEPDLASTPVGTAASVIADGHQALTGCIRWVSREAAFTPYYALSEHDRHRLAFVAEISLDSASAADLPTGLPVRVTFHRDQESCRP